MPALAWQGRGSRRTQPSPHPHLPAQWGWQGWSHSPGQGPHGGRRSPCPLHTVFCYTNKSSYIGTSISSLPCPSSSTPALLGGQMGMTPRERAPGPSEGPGVYQVCALPAQSVPDLHVPIIVLGPEAREADGLAAEVAQVDEAGGLRGAEDGHCHQQDLLPILPCKDRQASSRQAPIWHPGAGSWLRARGCCRLRDSPLSSLDWKRGALPQK